ncbi:MAG: radical SAM protein, partial [Candidatus Hadarchaeales archaeon]
FAERILPGLLEAYESPKIYKFLHLPVQSGDDGVLRDMRRGYTVETFRRVVRAFRQRFPDLQLVTDIIVGFPTESGEAFRRTLELVEEIRPDKVNLSKFSPLPGTDASRLKQLSSEEVAERSRILTGLCHRIGLEVNRRYVGKTFPALIVERGTRGGVLARTPNYKPVVLKEGAIGEEVCVTIVRAESTYLVGERV